MPTSLEYQRCGDGNAPAAFNKKQLTSTSKPKKAVFDLELAEVERQHQEQKVEEIKQKYIEYKMKKWLK